MFILPYDTGFSIIVTFTDKVDHKNEKEYTLNIFFKA